MLRRSLVGGCLLAAALSSGCKARDPSAATLLYPDPGEAAREFGRVIYASELDPRRFKSLRPIDRAGIVVDHERNLLYTGGADSTLLAFDLDNGELLWEHLIPGKLSSSPRIYGSRLLTSTEDGVVLSFDLDTHEILWTYETGGTVRQPAIVIEDTVFVATSRQQILALSLDTGEWRWQYGHDLIKDFTIVGQAGLTWLDRQDEGVLEGGTLYTGFDDGEVVALSALSGEAQWISRLPRPARGGFADADGTPAVDPVAKRLYVTSQDTGLHALELESGEIVWSLPMRAGGSPVLAPDGSIVVASSLEGVRAVEPSGRVLWRTQLDPGTIGAVVVIGSTVLLPHSESGLVVIDLSNGEVLARLDVGHGLDAPLLHDPVDDRVYFVSGIGTLYAVELAEDLHDAPSYARSAGTSTSEQSPEATPSKTPAGGDPSRSGPKGLGRTESKPATGTLEDPWDPDDAP